MRILQIKLHKFKRMPLIDQDTATIDFTKKLNLIFGTNGSGKSKLMRELSPLPSDKEDFYPGGYKYITIEHNKDIYKLSSEFNEKSKFSFVVNDVELNPGYTVTVQKELVSQHFRIDADIHDILIGLNTFTGMNAIVRKKLFNLVSNINIEYVLDVYEDLKEKHKEKTSQLKVQSNLMQSELVKIVSPMQEAVFKADIELIKQSLDALMVMRAMSHKEPYFSTREAVTDYLELLSNNITEEISIYYNFMTSYPALNLDSMESEYKTKVGINDYKLLACYKKLESLTDAKHALDVQMSESSFDIKAKLSDIDKTIKGRTESLKLFKDVEIENSSEIYKQLTSMHYSLFETLKEMPSNADKHFGRVAFTDCIDKKQTLNTGISTLEKSIHKLTKDYEHVADHLRNNVTTCPSCRHQWNIQYTNENLLSIDAQLNKLKQAKSISEKELETVVKYLEDCSAYFEKYKIVMHARSNTYDLLNPMWESIDKLNLLMTDPSSIIMTIDNSIRDISIIEEIKSSDEKRKVLLDLLRISETKIGTDMDSVLKGIEETEEEVKILSQNKRHAVSCLEEIKTTRSVYDRLKRLSTQYEAHVRQLNHVAETEASESLLTLIDDTIRENKLKLLELQSKIEATDKIHYLVSKYKQEIDNIHDHIFTLDAMLKELSPKNGLIAKSIGAFVNKLISNMNSIIAPIWSYDFSIVPYDVENDDKLDYKFKVMVNGEVATPDVTRTSGGMREIIDLSFRLTVMKFLGLSDYPCYLDEFGVKLDVHHRSRVHSLIANFVSDSNYSQVFLISHQDTSYSNMKDSDVIIISGDNIAYKDSRNILMLT